MNNKEERLQVELENEGQKIFGILHKPIAEDPVPCVLFCHGLAGHKIGKHRIYVSVAQALLEIGIASLRIDFRGNGDSEGNLADMTIDSEVSDAFKALEFIKGQEFIDPKKIGLFGRSLGGAIALIVAEKFQEIRSIALWAPIFHGEQWKEKWDLVRASSVGEEEQEEMMRFDGQLPGMGFYKQFFTMDLASVIKKLDHLPLLHIHGEKDHIVTIDHAEEYEKLRDRAHAETEFLRLPESDHYFTNFKETQTAIRVTTEWFNRTLKGFEWEN